MSPRALVPLVLAAALWSCGGESTTNREVDLGDTAVRREAGLDVLLITVDTLRADALGSYGNQRAQTPWMDRLAERGVRFDTARAHNVVTLPTHASILTGLYPQQHGVRDNAGFRLPGDLPTLAGLLREQGYGTGAFVSAFPLDSRFGLDQGFDVYEDSFVGTARRQAFMEEERSGVETVALAARWIESVDDKPWFCWVHLYEPHVPYAPQEPFRSRLAGDPYLGDVAVADAALAPLLEPILAGEDGGRTLVVLTSDHGEALGEHGEATHGIFGYESTLRVPLVFHQSRILEPRVIGDPVRHIDLLPTILDLLAQPVPANLPGRSLLPVLAGEPGETSPPSYFEVLSGQLNRGWAPLYGVVDGDRKYIELPIPELYALDTDPGEEDNLADVDAEGLAEMQGILALFRAEDPGLSPVQEDAETADRLRSLGYLSGGGGEKRDYGEEDDPKRLIGLDDALREVATLYAQGDLESALEQARALVKRRPGMRMALMNLAHIERESGNLEAAVEAMREAYVLHPTDTGTLALLGAYLTQAGRAGEAVEITETESRLAEPDVEVLLVRAIALARMRQGRKAFAELEKAQRLDPENPKVPVHFGTLYLMQGRRDEAKTSLEQALTMNPGTVAALTSLGVIAADEGRGAAAADYWRQAVTLDPEQLPRLLGLGMRLWDGGQTAMARPLLEVFVATAPRETFGREVGRVESLLATTG